MLGTFQGLTPEIVAGGLIGFSMLGVVIRNVILGWREANAKVKESKNSGSLISAVGISWDRDQIDRALQLLEDVSESLKSISKAQGILSDQFQQTTQGKLDKLLAKLDRVETPPSSRTRRRPD